MALVSATKGTATPEQIALLEDYQAAELTKAKMKRVGKTLEVLFKHQLDEPIPNFKRRFKQMVRRAKIKGVAYIKLGFQPLLETKPETSSRIHDASQKIAELEALAKQVSQKNSDETHTKEMEQLKHQMTLLQQEPKQIIKEGLVFSYPKSTAVFPDEECENIDGFVGASYIFEEHLMTPKDILKFFDLDVGENSGREYRKFSKDLAQKDDQGAKRKRKTGNDYGRVYEIYDLDNQVRYWVLEGYDGFLKPPGLPDVWLEQFHPYYPLVINPLDDEADPYSESDVDDMRPMQMEYNRARQGLREHRQVNRPGYMGPKAFFSESEGQTLASHAVGQYIGLEALSPNDDVDISKKMQAKPVMGIDPNQYDVGGIMQDVLVVQGSQEANLGPTSGSTATESSIAAESRATGLTSETDEIDDYLSLLSRGAAQILLSEMSVEQVKKLAGPGAAWPEFARQEYADEVYLEVLAGSSGRPNRQLTLQALERAGPILIQVPGLNVKKVGQSYVQAIDETADIDEWIDASMPSITAMNAQGPQQTGPNNPRNQGQEGSNKAPRPDQPQKGDEATFPGQGQGL